MAKRKAKKQSRKKESQSRKNKPSKLSKLWISIKVTLAVSVLLILLLILAFFMAQVTGSSIFAFTGLSMFQESSPFELTENDVFSMKDLSGDKVKVFGIGLGSSAEEVHEVLGKGDAQQLHEPNVLNLEYGESIETDGIGLLIHMESGIVTSITVKEPFNKYLQGKSKVQGDKTDLYRIHGKPSRLEIHYPFTYYYYDNENYDVIMDAGDMNGYTFRY